MGKLTKAQASVLNTLGDQYVVSMTPYALGAHGSTIGKLLSARLIEQVPPAKIVWTKHTMFQITDAGRQALSEGEQNG